MPSMVLKLCVDILGIRLLLRVSFVLRSPLCSFLIRKLLVFIDIGRLS